MTAAEIAAVVSAGPINGGSARTTTGYLEAVYTITTATTLDWGVFSDFSEVKYVHAYTTATGVDAEAYVDTSTKNKVFFVITGATTILVKGTKAVD